MIGAWTMSDRGDHDGTDDDGGERSGRREQNKAENRTALLKAARTVFAEMGYGAASVRDIVRRTDLASGTFYNYFKDKDEIFEAVVRELTVELLRRHREGRAKARTAEEFFRAPCLGLFQLRRRGPRDAGVRRATTSRRSAR